MGSLGSRLSETKGPNSHTNAADGTKMAPRVRRFRRAALRASRLHARPFPWRQAKDPYAVLVGEILLQRTRAENAADVYLSFIAKWPDYGSLSDASVRSIESVIRPLGLLKRAIELRKLARELVLIGRMPLTPSELERLPGVGPYVAHAVPVFAARRNLPLVDWVIARVLRRYFGLSGEGRPNADTGLWELSADIARAGRAREVWIGTLDFAAAVCKPRPVCNECSLRDSCCYAGQLRPSPGRKATGS